MSSSKFEHSPDSERTDHESGEAPTSQQPAVAEDPPWRDEREPAPSAGPHAPLSRAPDSMWSEPDDEGNEDEAVADDAPDTCPYPWTPQTAPDSSASESPASSCASSRTPESALVHSSGEFHTVRTAAAHMGIKEKALRRLCRLGLGPNGIADLGEGILAFKVGRFWRIRFPWWQ